MHKVHLVCTATLPELRLWSCTRSCTGTRSTDWLGSTPSKLSRGCFKVFSKLSETEKVHKEEEKSHRHGVHRLASCLSSRLLPSHLNRLLSLALLSVCPLSLGRRLFSLCKSLLIRMVTKMAQNGRKWVLSGHGTAAEVRQSCTWLLHLRLHPSAQLSRL